MSRHNCCVTEITNPQLRRLCAKWKGEEFNSPGRLLRLILNNKLNTVFAKDSAVYCVYGNYPLTVGKRHTYISEYGECETRYSSDGQPYVGWKRYLRINELIRQCVIYLYSSEEEAKAGSNYGGSGFLVYVPAEGNLDPHLYAITNAHVVREHGNTVIRAMKHQRTSVIRQLGPEDWIDHPKDDISVCPIGRWRTSGLYAIPADHFLTESLMREHDIGYGDDLYMVGRFIGRDGKQKNSPCMRFGNISMMPEIFERLGNSMEESFGVEIRSKTGFSGSPVFVYFEPELESGEKHGYCNLLLGMIRNDVPLYEEIVGVDEDGKENIYPVYAKVNSGIAGVIPAWRILDVLEGDELKEQRKLADDGLIKKNRPLIPAPRKHSTQPPQPFTKADFEAALKKVARKIKPEEK